MAAIIKNDDNNKKIKNSDLQVSKQQQQAEEIFTLADPEEIFILGLKISAFINAVSTFIQVYDSIPSIDIVEDVITKQIDNVPPNAYMLQIPNSSEFKQLGVFLAHIEYISSALPLLRIWNNPDIRIIIKQTEECFWSRK